MLSKQQDAIPRGESWLYEPKWDGFRAIVFMDGEDVHIGSRRSLPLQRYFPDVVGTLRDTMPPRCVVDGEIIIAGEAGLEFEALQLRLHPAASRVRKLAAETPASFVAFDMLALDNAELRDERFDVRRAKLASCFEPTERCLLTPQTADPDEAARWFDEYEGAGLDGVVAKRADQRYAPGERVMVKVKHLRTADCVVGGYRLAKAGDGIGSLLLGLYDDEGRLLYVGHTSSFKAAERRKLLERLQPLVGGRSFGGEQEWGPGGQSRWNAGRESQEWVALEPELVCEVSFDHMQGHRFRHATRFLRWRPDREPASCTYEQLAPPNPFSLSDIVAKTT
jgi:ATP-dependent DNA ligase